MKTAAQMRDQGHALKQKALELVASAEERVSNVTNVWVLLQFPAGRHVMETTGYR